MSLKWPILLSIVGLLALAIALFAFCLFRARVLLSKFLRRLKEIDIEKWNELGIAENKLYTLLTFWTMKSFVRNELINEFIIHEADGYAEQTLVKLKKTLLANDKYIYGLFWGILWLTILAMIAVYSFF